MRPGILSLTLIFPLLGTSLRASDPLVDISREAGLRFRHVAGVEQGHRYLVETMGGGAGWIDFDGDGWWDIYIVQSHSDVSNAASAGEQHNVLYRNRGDGTYEEVSVRAGVADRHYGSGLAVGDVDNDGDADLYVTNFGRNSFYLNRGDGTFEDRSESCGAASPLWGTSACFADFDGDGFLDLYVANYLEYQTDPRFICKGNRLKRPDYCHPNRFPGAPDRIYRGDGRGGFEDRTATAGVGQAGMFEGKGLGVLPTDIDRDGDFDILVANDSVPNQVWRNLGDFRFEEIALELGIALNPDGKALAGMGVDAGDVDRDGLLDYTITNFAKESNTLFLGHESGFFLEGGAIRGIAGPSYLPLAFGTTFFDLELDGDLDLYVACGHVSSLIEELYPGSGEIRLQPDMLYLNDGAGKFSEVSKRSGAWFQKRFLGRAVARADHDNDGDLDLLVANVEGPAVLLENRSERSGHHWLGLHLRGDGQKVNRDAIGARVIVRPLQGKAQVFERQSSGSYLASHDPRILVGLGASRGVREVEVLWPDGKRELFRDLEVDGYREIVYGQGE